MDYASLFLPFLWFGNFVTCGACMQVTKCTCSDKAALHNQARLLAAHQACALLKFLTHALGMLLWPVIYPSQVSSRSLSPSTALARQPHGKAEVHSAMLCQSPASLGFLSSPLPVESNYSNNQALCITWAGDSRADQQTWPGPSPGHCATVAQSTLSDPGQMWEPITLQTVISGSRSSFQWVTQSRCWNGNDKSTLWGVKGGFLWENQHKCNGTDWSQKGPSLLLLSYPTL